MRVQHPGPVNVDKLTEELLATFPTLVTEQNGVREARYRASIHPTEGLTIDVDDALALEQNAVAAVLAAHDPAVKTQAQLDAEARQEVETTTRAEVEARLDQFDAALGVVKDDWGTLTAGQKADAMRALLLIVAYGVRWLLARTLR